jgi:hypothetical protein
MHQERETATFRQWLFNAIWLLGDNPQIAKPPFVQTAHVIQIHDVLEDEMSTRLYVVSEIQSGLQGMVIIDSDTATASFSPKDACCAAGARPDFLRLMP